MPDKNYQPNYKPSPYSEEDVKNLLWKSTYKQQAIDEVKRVALNMWNALENPETPEIVKKRIKAYFYYHLNFELTKHKSALVTIYSIGCLKTSEIPFVPFQEYIEALTGDDKEKAIVATEENTDIATLDTIDADQAEKITKDILSDVENMPFALASLVVGIGNETHPVRKSKIVDAITYQCFFETLYHNDEYSAFINKAMDYFEQESN